MTRKPKGAKYRNLTTRGGVIYYERAVNERSAIAMIRVCAPRASSLVMMQGNC